MSTETKLLIAFAGICWTVWSWAFVAMLLGNPTAINGVVGIGIPALMCTAAAVIFHRDDKPARPVESKPDYAAIAQLERELGIGD